MTASSNLKKLRDLRTSFGKKYEEKKLSLLQKMSKAIITDSDSLLEYHDALSFARAYPDNRTILTLAEQELQSFGDRIKHYMNETGDDMVLELLNSGITNTIVTHSFGYETLRQLLSWYPEMVEIDWESLGEDEDSKTTELLQLLVSWQENDAIDNDWMLDTNEWLRLSRGKNTPTGIGALYKLFSSSNIPHNTLEYLFDSLELPVNWFLTDSPSSRSMKRVPWEKTFYHKEPLRRRTPNLRTELAKRPARLRHLSPKEGEFYVRSINEVLAVRARELYPLTYANPKEVYIYEPGRGVQIVVLGAKPQVRLPLESNFGAMLVRNGLPVGYGVGATLFDRVEIAINVFPAFRSGESSYIIEQFFRLFYHHFGSRVLLVRSRQMGDGDIEPLQSGAFWFYNKLGFRPINQRVRDLAESESERIAKEKGYRCPMRMLKRLAKSDVFFHADPSKMDGYREFPIVNLGYVVTKYFADKFDGNRPRGIRKALSDVSHKLGLVDLQTWSGDEITALERLAPMIACIPDLNQWSSVDKAELARIIRAKGSACERQFVLLTNRHPRFRLALEKLATDYERSKT